MIDKNTQEQIDSMTEYNLFLSGTAEGTAKDFAVAISEKQMIRDYFHNVFYCAIESGTNLYESVCVYVISPI